MDLFNSKSAAITHERTQQLVQELRIAQSLQTKNTIFRLLGIFALTIFFSSCNQNQQKKEPLPEKGNASQATSVENTQAGEQTNSKQIENDSFEELSQNKSKSHPRRRSLVGHVISYVGHTWNEDSKDLHLFFHDPADNNPIDTLEHNEKDLKAIHNWLSKPTKRIVSCGTRRPSIVLTNDLSYTIVGAIKLQPNRPFQQNNFHPPLSYAHGMPDLSQHIRTEWTGLCAATAAADMLYYAALRNPQFTEGRHPGPGEKADKAANSLIATRIETDNQNKFQNDFVSPSSLAGLMHNNEGKGATAIGIAHGLRNWLDNRNINNWRVDIDFLDDTVPLVESTIQQDWLLSLASLTAQGGGAILLLWEGVDWANEEIGFDPDQDQDLDPRFEVPTVFPPELADVAKQTEIHSLPAENSSPPSQGVSHLKKLLLDAHVAASDEKNSKAKKIIEEIFETGQPLRFNESEIDQILKEARQLSAMIDKKTSGPIRLREGIPTEFTN